MICVKRSQRLRTFNPIPLVRLCFSQIGRTAGAQGSGLEDVTVEAGDGLAGVVGGCGSGGAHHGLKVTGGRYGLDLRQSQPAYVNGILRRHWFWHLMWRISI
jgi:hypothetical protein